MTITIGGKEYEGAKYTLDVYERAVACELKLADLYAKMQDDPANDDLVKQYNALWLKYCGIQVVGDVSALARDKISPTEGQELRFFFVRVLAEMTQKLRDGQERFAGIIQSTDQPKAS